MGILSRVESFLERFLEAPAGRLGASIQPVSLAKRIERAMDTNKTYRDSGVIVPNQYALHLHPSDFAAFASYRSSLEDDLAHGVLARARHERYTLVARPRVEIISDEETRRGEIRVAANVMDERGERVPEAMPMPANSDTMVFNRPDRRRRTRLGAARLPAGEHARQPTGAVRPRRAADRRRAGQRQRRDRRRPDGQPPPLPAQAPARRLRLRRSRAAGTARPSTGSRSTRSRWGRATSSAIGDTEIEFQVRG